jgi:hypothetical protein
MSTTIADRWVVLPFATATGPDGSGERVPKYVRSDDRLAWWAGTVVDMSAHPEYPQVSGEHLLARVHGEWQALQELSAKADTRTIAIDGAQAKAMLDRRFGDTRPVGDWQASFRCEGRAPASES